MYRENERTSPFREAPSGLKAGCPIALGAPLDSEIADQEYTISE
jgi:hypothetical protein